MAIKLTDTIQKIWTSLIQAGLTKEGAAGVMGNLWSQSRCNPTCVEGLLLKRYKEDGKFDYFPYGIYDQKNYDIYVSLVDTGKLSKEQFLNPRAYDGIHQYGFGLSQTTSRSRKEKLWEMTRGKNKSIADVDGQVEHLVYELKNLYSTVWNTVSTTKSINDASDIVLTKFEAPSNANSYKITRRQYSNQMYDICKDLKVQTIKQQEGKNNNNMLIDFTKYYGKISNSGGDERGKAKGGQAGDQTGNQWNIRNWYNRPWACILRYPDPAVRQLIAILSIEAANNNKIGYDQSQRHTYWQALKEANYRPSKISWACEADCSAGVIGNTRATGYLLNIPDLKNIQATYTGDMRKGFKAAGFEVLTDSKYIGSTDYLVPGDILLYDNHHTATNLGIGSKSGYKQGALKEIPNVKYEYKPSTGTSTTTTTTVATGKNITNTSTKTIQKMLNVVGDYKLEEDGVFGKKTTVAVRDYQKKNDLEVDGIVGNATLTKLKAEYDKATKKQEVKVEYGTVAAYLLNVRIGPGMEYANLKQRPVISQGTKVEILKTVKSSKNENWYVIKIEGKQGYVKADFIKK